MVSLLGETVIPFLLMILTVDIVFFGNLLIVLILSTKKDIIDRYYDVVRHRVSATILVSLLR